MITIFNRRELTSTFNVVGNISDRLYTIFVKRSDYDNAEVLMYSSQDIRTQL